jgi:hypothetical protein
MPAVRAASFFAVRPSASICGRQARAIIELQPAIPAVIQAASRQPLKHVQCATVHGVDPIALFEPGQAERAATRATAEFTHVERVQAR